MPQQYPIHSNVVAIPHTVSNIGNAVSAVCMDVSVGGGKSEVGADDSATEYSMLGVGANRLVSQNLETISARCPFSAW